MDNRAIGSCSSEYAQPHCDTNQVQVPNANDLRESDGSFRLDTILKEQTKMLGAED